MTSIYLQIVIQWHLNSFFFQKITKNRLASSGLGFAPRPPSVIRLSYTTSLNTSSNLDIRTFDFWIPLPIAKSCLRGKHRLRLLIF